MRDVFNNFVLMKCFQFKLITYFKNISNKFNITVIICNLTLTYKMFFCTTNLNNNIF